MLPPAPNFAGLTRGLLRETFDLGWFLRSVTDDFRAIKPSDFRVMTSTAAPHRQRHPRGGPRIRQNRAPLDPEREDHVVPQQSPDSF
jgi:hypothetical protein